MEQKINYTNKKHWLSLWHRLGVYSYDRIINSYIELLKRYNEPHRKYHNLNHINHCLAEFNTVFHLAKEPDALELAIWYHDAIYEIGASDNEKKSSLLVDGVMSGFLVSEELIKTVKDIIIATEHNKVPESFDARLMLDIDISNLGQAEKFKETNRLVREEYSLVPENLFNNGRSNILQSFLDRPNIYLTDVFREKYENNARKNLQQAIREFK
jgi:predicted metal-dependent HD superfamily phosphohydrolase